jgi:subtilisin family serine protease
VPGDSGCYTWLTGTSMATPFVSGAAALLWSRPDITSNSEVLNILLNSADGQGVGGPRLDSWTIHGGLNLRSALMYSLTRPVANAGADQTVPDNDGDGTALVTVDGSASFDRNGTIVGYAWKEGNSLLSSSAIATIPLTVGAHTLTLVPTPSRLRSLPPDKSRWSRQRLKPRKRGRRAAYSRSVAPVTRAGR